MLPERCNVQNTSVIQYLSMLPSAPPRPTAAKLNKVFIYRESSENFRLLQKRSPPMKFQQSDNPLLENGLKYANLGLAVFAHQ